MATVTHQFEWTEEYGSEIYVTGTFDSWSKSVQLAKDPVTGRYTAKVALPLENKVLYKFVVDGMWKVSDKYPTEPDEEGNSNNILHAASLVAPSESGIAGERGPASPIKDLAEAPEMPSAAPTTMDEVRTKMATMMAPVAAVPAVAAIGRSLGYGENHEQSTSPTSPRAVTDGVPGGYPALSSLDRNASYGQTSSGDSPVLESVGNQPPAGLAPTYAVAATEAKALAQQSIDGSGSTTTKYSKDEIAVGSAVAAGAIGGAAGAAAYSAAEKDKQQHGVIPVTGDANVLQSGGATASAPLSSTAPVSRDGQASDSLPLSTETTHIPSQMSTGTANETSAAAATTSTQKAEAEALGATGIGATAAVVGSRSTKTQTEQLEAAAVNASKHAADRAIAGVQGGNSSSSGTSATTSQFNADAALKSFDKGSGITAIGTAQTTDTSDSSEHPQETGMSKMVATKAESGQVHVEENVKTGVIGGVNLSNHQHTAATAIQNGNTKVERLGDGSRAAVASTTVVKTVDGQQIRAIGTAVVTDGSQTAEELKQDLAANGSGKSAADLPDGAISHLTSPPTAAAAADATTTTATTNTNTTSNATVSTPSKQQTTSSTIPSGTAAAAAEEEKEKKKKKGIWKKIKKALA